MIINPVTITMSKDEAERVWSVVDKRIKALGENSAERRVLEQALDALGPRSACHRLDQAEARLEMSWQPSLARCLSLRSGSDRPRPRQQRPHHLRDRYRLG